MEETLEQQIEARLAELPEAIREAILSNDIGGHIRTIGTNHKLHVDQLAILEDITIMTMLGFSPNAEFENQLKNQLSIDDNTAQALAGDINTEIFMVVRESLKNPTPTPAAAPAAAAPQTGSTPAPAATPIKIQTPTTTPAPAAVAPTPTASPAKPAELHPADFMLSQKTVTTAPAAPAAPAAPSGSTPTPAAAAPTATKPQPPAPKPYTADPYREPTE